MQAQDLAVKVPSMMALTDVRGKRAVPRCKIVPVLLFILDQDSTPE